MSVDFERKYVYVTKIYPFSNCEICFPNCDAFLSHFLTDWAENWAGNIFGSRRVHPQFFVKTVSKKFPKPIYGECRENKMPTRMFMFVRCSMYVWIGLLDIRIWNRHVPANNLWSHHQIHHMNTQTRLSDLRSPNITKVIFRHEWMLKIMFF